MRLLEEAALAGLGAERAALVRRRAPLDELRGMAAQLTLTNGPSARWLRRWMAREMSSLPVPLSR